MCSTDKVGTRQTGSVHTTLYVRLSMIRHFLMPSHSCSRRLGRVVDHHIIMLLKMYDARLKYERSMYSNTNGIHGMECRFLHEVYCLRTTISVDLQPSIFNLQSSLLLHAVPYDQCLMGYAERDLCVAIRPGITMSAKQCA